MALKTYKVTFSHLNRLDKNGNPQIFITAVTVVARNTFTCRVQFYRHHNNKTNNILYIQEVKQYVRRKVYFCFSC